jgi:hypothetical protein
MLSTFFYTPAGIEQADDPIAGAESSKKKVFTPLESPAICSWHAVNYSSLPAWDSILSIS